MPEKGFRPEIFLRLKYFSEKIPPSQKLLYFKGNRFTQSFILSTALRCLFYTKLFPNVSSAFNSSFRKQLGLCETRKHHYPVQPLVPCYTPMVTRDLIISLETPNSFQDPANRICEKLSGKPPLFTLLFSWFICRS